MSWSNFMTHRLIEPTKFLRTPFRSKVNRPVSISCQIYYTDSACSKRVRMKNQGRSDHMTHTSFEAVHKVVRSRPPNQNSAIKCCRLVGVDRLRLANPVNTAGDSPLAVPAPDGTALPTVSPSTTTAVPLGARLYSTLEIVTPGAPGRIVYVPTTSAVDE
jgi:hypothetical protein